MTKEYEEYQGKKVRVLVDGKAYSLHSNASIELEAQVSEETDNSLKLEYIVSHNTHSPLMGKFGKGTINKNYIIGVFEKIE